MSPTNNLIYRPWDQVLRERFDVFLSIIRNNDKELMAAVIAQNRMSMVDWDATLNSHAEASGPSVLEDKDVVLKTLLTESLKTNDRLNNVTKAISDTMKDTASNDANEEQWKSVLAKAIETFQNKFERQMMQLRDLWLDQNASVDTKYQAYVTNIYTNGATYLAGYYINNAGLVRDAVNTVGDWYKDPFDMIKKFDANTKQFYQQTAWNIKNAYPDYLNKQIGADSLSTIHGQSGIPSALADKDDVLKTLKDILLKTNQLIREDTNEISRNFEQLANKGGNEEEWVKALDDAEDLMSHKALDQMTEMKKFAINRINSVDAKYRNKVGEIFGHACTALTGFQGSVHLFIKVAKGTADKWYRNPWDNLKIFQRSTKIWYDGAEQGIKRAFPDYLVSDSRRGEDSLSSIQDIATQLQGMGVDNITIIPKGDGWALEIGAGM